MTNYKLIYFDGRGRGEVARMIFRLAGKDFEDYRVPLDNLTPGPEWAELKKRLPFGQVPLLEFDGKELAQSNAINRYLAREFGLYGSSSFEMGQIDMWVEAAVDIIQKFEGVVYEQDEKKKAAVNERVKSVAVPPILTKLQQTLDANKSGFLVGNKVSLADLTFLATYDAMCTDLEPATMTAIMTEYKRFDEYIKGICAVPAIAQWRKIRPKTKF